VSAGHLRVRGETGANLWLLVLAVAAAVTVLVTFAFTTLVEEPGTAIALVAILVMSIALDLGWKRRRPEPPAVASDAPDGPVHAPQTPTR
jgi:hypothetical protein